MICMRYTQVFTNLTSYNWRTEGEMKAPWVSSWRRPVTSGVESGTVLVLDRILWQLRHLQFHQHLQCHVIGHHLSHHPSHQANKVHQIWQNHQLLHQREHYLQAGAGQNQLYQHGEGRLAPEGGCCYHWYYTQKSKFILVIYDFCW